jgi:hypothetical protein
MTDTASLMGKYFDDAKIVDAAELALPSISRFRGDAN